MDQILRAVLDRLVSWSVLTSLGVKDVLYDDATGTVALIGPALKLERNIMIPQFVRNYNYRLNTDFGAHFGIPVEVEKWEGSYRVKDTRPMWFHGETTGDHESGEHIADFLQGLSHALRDAIARIGGEDPGEETLTVTLITEPGYPYTPGKTTEVYSAKKRKTAKVGEPPWLMQVKDRDGKARWGVDFCKLMPVICPSRGTAIVGTFKPYRDLEFVVTHAGPLAFGGKLRDEEKRARLQRCPGLLFPSLASGIIPATNFGETVLVVRPDVILSTMKPYMQRGAYAVTTYNSDTWTETAGGFLEGIAIEAFEQLHGNANYMYTNHAYVLGPEIKATGFHDEPAKPITSTAKFANALTKRFKKWTRAMTPAKFKQLSESMTVERYAYCESKVNIVLGWGCVPLAVTPRQFAMDAENNLRAMGFTGDLITVDAPDDIAAVYAAGNMPLTGRLADAMKTVSGELATEWRQYQYAWMVRDAILEYAKSKGGDAFFPVTEA